MKKIVKTLYATLYQKTKGVSYREQVIVTASTIAVLTAILIPLITILIADVL